MFIIVKVKHYYCDGSIDISVTNNYFYTFEDAYIELEKIYTELLEYYSENQIKKDIRKGIIKVDNDLFDMESHQIVEVEGI